MKTYSANYYLHKAFALIFGASSLGHSIYGLINPDSFTVIHNDEVVETNFVNLLPLIITGSLATLLFIWMVRNYFKIKMDEEGITVAKLGGNELIKWEDIELIDGVDWLWKGMIFKVRPKNSKTFYFHADKPTMSFKDMFSGGFRTQMAEYVKSKKIELGI